MKRLVPQPAVPLWLDRRCQHRSSTHHLRMIGQPRSSHCKGSAFPCRTSMLLANSRPTSAVAGPRLWKMDHSQQYTDTANTLRVFQETIIYIYTHFFVQFFCNSFVFQLCGTLVAKESQVGRNLFCNPQAWLLSDDPFSGGFRLCTSLGLPQILCNLNLESRRTSKLKTCHRCDAEISTSCLVQ